MPTFTTFARKFLPERKSHLSQEPDAAMFRGLRIRLTFWYSAVLAVALVVFGVSLYFGVRLLLFSQVQQELAGHAHMIELRGASFHTCLSGPPDLPPNTRGGMPLSEMDMCFDQNGNIVSPHTDQLPAAFVNNSLALQAVQERKPVTDIVDSGTAYGPIYRYALAMPAQDGGVIVVQVGQYIGVQTTTLSILLMLLVVIGGLALVGAGLGGLFLADRALAPARLAWNNQQRFITDASHELRTPLTLLRADAEVLLRNREQLTNEDVLLLENIVTESYHMATLANNMLMLARLDHGTPHQEHDVVKLADMTRAATQRIEALAAQKQIKVEVETSEDAMVIGDATLLEQALLVLLDNAIKYNRQGGQVTVRAGLHGGKATVEVNDSGPGIEAEHMPHLGERFYRVDKARSRQAGGTGLGLSIARGITTAHHGTLTMTSVPNEGTTVKLLLPPVQRTASARGTDAIVPKTMPPQKNVITKGEHIV